METRLCRICGKLGENYVHIFKTEGLKNKIETCLPIIVSTLLKLSFEFVVFAYLTAGFVANCVANQHF